MQIKNHFIIIIFSLFNRLPKTEQQFVKDNLGVQVNQNPVTETLINLLNKKRYEPKKTNKRLS